MRSLTRRLLSYDHELLELHMALLKLVWGGWILLPFELYQKVPSTRGLTDLIPEIPLGLIFLALGISQMFAVLNRRRLLDARAYMAMFSIFLWIILAVMSFYGSPFSPSGPTLLVFAITNMVIYLKVKTVKKALATPIQDVRVA